LKKSNNPASAANAPVAVATKAFISAEITSGDPFGGRRFGLWVLRVFRLAGFGAGSAYTKGLNQLLVGDLTGQVRFAPLRGRFLKEIWT